MFFDDRLATVLRQRPHGDASQRTQFRQLLDILGAERMGEPRPARDSSLIASAWLRMDALADAIPASERARMIREPGWRFRNPELAAHLADFEPDVAAAALARAQLTVEDWTALIPRLPVRARGFLRLRRDLPVEVVNLLERLGVHDRGLPQPAIPLDAEAVEDLVVPAPDLPEPAAPSPAPVPERVPERVPEPEGRSEISALVERIAQFKRDRERVEEPPAHAGDNDNALMPRLPLGEGPLQSAKTVSGFSFVADTAGRIEWADGDVARMVIGTRLFPPRRLGTGTDDNPVARAYSRRQPLVQMAMALDGAQAIAGEWMIDAQPRFTDDGHFAGYLGRFRRMPDARPPRLTAAEREADRIRQLLHELRTPVTAVQGYAEVIQQQLFGFAPHEYRGLAAAIAADAARILAGFEELDRLARLETAALDIDPGTSDLGDMVRQTTGQLALVLAPRLAGIALEPASTDGAPVAVDADHLEALLWRLLATLGGGCATGETITARIECAGAFARLICELPAQLRGEDDIFAAQARPVGGAINAGLFGAGFTLRLARAEARAAGGALTRDGDRLLLTLPALDCAAGAGEQADADV